MEVEKTPLEGVLLIKPQTFPDERGFFLETYREKEYREAGVETTFIQANHSRSTKGTLRGLHFQTEPGQAKLVYSPRGRVWDVAVDVRKKSPTYGKYFGAELSDENHHQLYVPIGFAHGFCVLSEDADFTYLVGSYYDGKTEAGIIYNDPDLAVPWPVENPIVSKRDAEMPRLKDFDFSETVWNMS